MRKILTAFVLFLVATAIALGQTVPLGPRFVLPYQTVIDGTGVPLAGAQLNFYISGTNTRLNTYSDPLLTVANLNPVVANAAGVFPNIFLNGNYKVVLTDSAVPPNQIWTADPVDSVGAGTIIGPNGSTIGDIPQFNNTTGTSLADNASIATSQQFYFGGGRPWCDVRAKGAVGNGATDDTAAFVACVGALNAVNGGTLYMPSGIYCLFSGLTISAAINLVGEALGSTELSTCGHDVTLLTLNFARIQARELSIIGSTTVGTIKDTIALGSSCGGCRLDRIYGAYGRYAINNSATDVHASDIEISSTYGAAVLYATGGMYCTRCKIDQGFPVQTPTFGYTVSAWTANHSYNKGDIVSTGGYRLQANNAGTSSAGSAPTVLGYSVPIPDGVTGTCPSASAGVCWFLVRPNSTYSAVQVNTGAFDVTLLITDMTGSYDYGVNITGAVSNTVVTDSFIGQVDIIGIYSQAGFNSTITNTQVANCLQSGCEGIFLHGAGDDIVIGNSIYGVVNGIVADAGNNRTIANNLISASSSGGIGIDLIGSLLRHTITGNLVGTSQFGSAPATGIQINNTGSDYITVLANQCNGASTCITNNSTGVHNLIESTPGTLITSPTFTKGPIMTLGSDATGDMYYRNASGVLTRFPVCTGTNVVGAAGGVPTCVTQGGVGGALTFLCSIVASNSAALSYASPTSGTCTIDSSYKSYMLVFQNIVPASNEKILQFLIHSGGAFKNSGYLTNETLLGASGVTGSQGATTYIPLTFPADANGNALANAAPGFSGQLILTNPSVSAIAMVDVKGFYTTGSGTIGNTLSGGYWNTAGVVDGFEALMDTGNITSGSILVYGVQ